MPSLDDDDDRCARCGAPDPSPDNFVSLFRPADPDAEELGDWTLCDRCAVDFQNVFLGKRSGSNCAHCGAREPKASLGWARVMAGAPIVEDDGSFDESSGEESDDPICAQCIALVRTYVNPSSS